LPGARFSHQLNADWFNRLRHDPALTSTSAPSPLIAALRTLGTKYRQLDRAFDATEHAMTVVDALANTYPTPRQASSLIQPAFSAALQEWRAIQSERRADCPAPYPLISFNAPQTDPNTAKRLDSLKDALPRLPPSTLLSCLYRLYQAHLTLPPHDIARQHRPARHLQSQRDSRSRHRDTSDEPTPKRRRN
jgi:hypothetical protein